MAQTRSEQDIRLELLNTLLTTPHRQLQAIWPVHENIVTTDPRFYVRLAAWYADHGDVRDHKEMFAAALSLSGFEGHRDVGLALLRQLPPYEVARVLDFVHGRKTTRTVRAARQPRRRTADRPAAAPSPRARRRGVLTRLAGLLGAAQPSTVPVSAEAPKAEAAPAAVQKVTENFGLFRSPPRSMRTEIERYLREREADADWFDSTALVARKSLKRLYALLHIKPSERAQRILFAGDPPQGSRIYALRQLAKTSSPEDQARVIVELRLPYRVAATVITQMTPAVLAALVNAMSAQELINNLGSLRKRGAMDNAEIKALIEQKLEQAGSAQRVSALKTRTAAEASGVSADVREKLERAADTQVKAKGRIRRPTALLIDKSGSMSQAIELGKRIGALVSAVAEADLFVYAFDTMAYPIARGGDDLASWERSLAGITASGGTSCGVALEHMIRQRQYVEQIILVTDEGENTGPLFVPTLRKYRDLMAADPGVCIVRVPGAVAHLEGQCRAAGVTADVFAFGGDYYSLPNLVPLLSRTSKLELLMEIMGYPLPKRRCA